MREANGPAKDSIAVEQQVEPLVPAEVWAATVARVGDATEIPLSAPAGALPGRGSVELRLASSLTPPLDGVRAYMAAYPYGCLEQRTSKAIVSGDTGAWNLIAAELPAYLDKDGFARYFTGDWPGSEICSSAMSVPVIVPVARSGPARPGQSAR